MSEAAVAEAEVSTPAGGDINEERSLASDAWRSMRRNPMFWVSAGLIAVFVLMAVWPSLFTSTNPTHAVLAESRQRPNANAWFGRDIQGYDIYARCIYGARASILVGLFATTDIREAARAGSSADALIPTGKPSAAPKPQIAAPR